MSVFFDAVISRFLENNKGFAAASTETKGSQEIAVITDGKANAKIVYSPDVNRFFLFRGEANCADGDYTELQSYFFEPTGDNASDIREAGSVANEFSETFGGPAPMNVIPDASRKTSKKDRESDESSAVFFVNRIPGILPECREPLLMHKEYFEILLPNKFCDEVVVSAVARLLPGVDQLLENTKLLSSDMAKAWRSARRFIGRQVKPEKESAYKQMSDKYRAQLMQNLQDK